MKNSTIILIVIASVGCEKLMAQPTFELLLAPWEQQVGHGICTTQDGGYLVAAGGLHPGFQDVASLIKLDAEGTQMWERTFLYGYLASGIDVIEDGNGDIYFLSEHSLVHQLDVKLQKFNASGMLLWDTLLYFSDDSVPYQNSMFNARSIAIGNNGNVVITGSGYDDGLQKASAAMLTPDGELLWFKFFLNDSSNIILNIKATPDGNYVMNTLSTDELVPTIHTIKIDDAGNVLWDRPFEWATVQEGRSIAVRDNGNYVVFATGTPDEGVTFYPFLVEYAENGDSLSYTAFPDMQSRRSGSVQMLGDSLFFLLCQGQDAIEMTLTDTMGTVRAVRTYGEEYSTDPYDFPRVGNAMVVVGEDYHFAFSGGAFEDVGKIYIVADTFFPDTANAIAETTTTQSTLLIYPNPASQSIRVEATGISTQPTTITITDMLGHAVLHHPSAGQEQNIDISGLANGVYTLGTTLPNGETRRERLVVQR